LVKLKPANSQTGFQPTFNIIYDSIFNFPTTSIINSSESILKWKRHTLDSQYSLFGDRLFICRSAYYLSGKCLMSAALPKKMMQPFSLWSFITSDANQIRKTLGTRLFLNNLSSKLLTKIQFEYYLLFTISGKVAETLMLFSNNSKNDSNIGIEELKQLGLLFRP
jgi:hypothetical protein